MRLKLFSSSVQLRDFFWHHIPKTIQNMGNYSVLSISNPDYDCNLPHSLSFSIDYKNQRCHVQNISVFFHMIKTSQILVAMFFQAIIEYQHL